MFSQEVRIQRGLTARVYENYTRGYEASMVEFYKEMDDDIISQSPSSNKNEEINQEMRKYPHFNHQVPDKDIILKIG